MNIVVAVTGASGALYAKLLLDELKFFHSEGCVERVGVVFSKNAKDVWAHELGVFKNDFAFDVFENDNFFAPFASGSALYDAMVVCPCSMGTMGKIANGISDTLITRAADVMIKERRKLILLVRETPIHHIHVSNMQLLSQSGVIIAPASPSFYSRPKTIEELSMTVVDRLLQLIGLNKDIYRWGN
jgi:4-hydroxy-3-polyprenylbenzoate decarboxylase